MIANDWECQKCGLVFEDWTGMNVAINSCKKCGHDECHKVFNKAPTIELKYNPKTDICDWDGNTTQYYRKYNEAKDRGENVRLPEEGE
jgi:putative FmdB family regulatory protein